MGDERVRLFPVGLITGADGTTALERRGRGFPYLLALRASLGRVVSAGGGAGWAALRNQSRYRGRV